MTDPLITFFNALHRAKDTAREAVEHGDELDRAKANELLAGLREHAPLALRLFESLATPWGNLTGAANELVCSAPMSASRADAERLFGKIPWPADKPRKPMRRPRGSESNQPRRTAKMIGRIQALEDQIVALIRVQLPGAGAAQPSIGDARLPEGSAAPPRAKPTTASTRKDKESRLPLIYNKDEAEARTGISKYTLMREVKADRLRCRRARPSCNSPVLFTEEDLLDWMQNHAGQRPHVLSPSETARARRDCDAAEAEHDN